MGGCGGLPRVRAPALPQNPNPLLGLTAPPSPKALSSPEPQARRLPGGLCVGEWRLLDSWWSLALKHFWSEATIWGLRSQP